MFTRPTYQQLFKKCELIVNLMLYLWLNVPTYTYLKLIVLWKKPICYSKIFNEYILMSMGKPKGNLNFQQLLSFMWNKHIKNNMCLGDLRIQSIQTLQMCKRKCLFSLLCLFIIVFRIMLMLLKLKFNC